MRCCCRSHWVLFYAAEEPYGTRHTRLQELLEVHLAAAVCVHVAKHAIQIVRAHLGVMVFACVCEYV